jgi:GT2 family glycosyltransferase
MMQRPYASIIVLSYNGLEQTTRPCLESLLRNTPPNSYELVVVDNGSSDGTPEYLRQLAKKHGHIRLHLNSVNRGFAGGNNDGLSLANGEYLVLLNNDTLVPDQWLKKLLHLLEINPTVGLVAPVTNSAGNEQCIELSGLNERNFQKTAERYTDRHRGVWFTTSKLGFFCVAMPRAVFEKTGYLDENFGIGMFEDDDYCLRVLQNGYALAVVEDCFVYHKGSVSFKKLSLESYHELFNRNKSYFYDKHNVQWTFSDIAFAYWHKFNIDLNTYVQANPDIDPALERILARFENFRHLLVQIHAAENRNKSGLPSINPLVSQSQWEIRRMIFQNEFVSGSFMQRINYIKALADFLTGKIIGH